MDKSGVHRKPLQLINNKFIILSSSSLQDSNDNKKINSPVRLLALNKSSTPLLTGNQLKNAPFAQQQSQPRHVPLELLNRKAIIIPRKELQGSNNIQRIDIPVYGLSLNKNSTPLQLGTQLKNAPLELIRKEAVCILNKQPQDSSNKIKVKTQSLTCSRSPKKKDLTSLLLRTQLGPIKRGTAVLSQSRSLTSERSQKSDLICAVPVSDVEESIVDPPNHSAQRSDDGGPVLIVPLERPKNHQQDKELLKARQGVFNASILKEQHQQSLTDSHLTDKQVERDQPREESQDSQDYHRKTVLNNQQSKTECHLTDKQGQGRGAVTDSKEISKEILDILPKKYDHQIQQFFMLGISPYGESNFNCTLRVNVTSAEEAMSWKRDFEASSDLDFRVVKCWNFNSTNRTIFKKKFRCHHNTLAERNGSKTPHDKHTKCEAELTVTVKNTNMKWSKDTLLQSHPCEVLMKNSHNQEIHEGDILKHRRPNHEVTKKFTQMFEKNGHTPTTAMDAHLADLEIEHGHSYCFAFGDGSICPSMPWVYKLYNKIIKVKCGEPTGEGMLSALQTYVDSYNEECGEVCAKIGVSENGQNHFVAVCSPLMKRIHTHYKGSAEIMMMDSSGCMDSTNSRVFVVLTPSAVCGLPLGMLITFSEKEEVITAALQLWKDILPEKAFYGRGKDSGPKIILTDDSTSERNSLRNSFLYAILLLCVFHILQAMWRYLWDADHLVKYEHRGQIYYLFHQIVYANSIDEFNSLYDNALQNAVVLQYALVVKHFKDLRNRAEEWAVCYRADLLTRGHHTNNYSEATMRIIKDVILKRVRAFNTVQLLDFFMTRLHSYWKRKIAFVVNNRVLGTNRSRYRIDPKKLVPLVPKKLEDSSDHLFKVKNIEKVLNTLLIHS